MMKRLQNAPRVLLSIFYCILLVACGEDNKDLTHYIHQVKQRKPQPVSPIPVFNSEPSVNYSNNEIRRNPFKPLDNNANFERRVKSILAGQSLDVLKFVGTIRQKQQIWGLIKGPGSQITVVHVGDYIGNNHRQILAIKNNMIQLEVTIKDSLDRWEKQVTTLDLNPK